MQLGDNRVAYKDLRAWNARRMHLLLCCYIIGIYNIIMQ